MRIEIDKIIVEDRYRKDYGDLNELAMSIKSHGQLQPVVVEKLADDKYKLLAGERRLLALQKLKETEIEVVFKTDLTDIERLEIELEENLHRKDWTWQEEVQIKSKIDELKRTLHGEGPGRSSGAWTIVDTANLLGESKSKAAADIALARGMEKYPELKNEKSKASAFKRLKILLEEDARKALARMQQGRAAQELLKEKIFHGDCLEVLRTLPDNFVHLVVTDPPYGVDYTNVVEMDETAGYTGFDDSKAATLDLIDLMLKELKRVMYFSSSLYMFFGITNYKVVYELLCKHFETVDPVPLIWFKQNIGGGRTTVPEIYQCRSYEVIFYARKGNRALIKQGQPNVLLFDAVNSRDKIHLTEKPTSLLRELIERSSIEGEVVLDPCAGSGSTLVAAKQLHRNYLGIEKEEHYFNCIIQRLAANVISNGKTNAG